MSYSIQRRWYILHSFAALIVLMGFALGATAAPFAGQARLYIGTYTSGTSVGIYQSSFDLGAGTLGTTNLAGTSRDPSFVALHPSGDFLYAVNEGGGYVVAFSVNRATGKLTLLNQQSSQGAAPCHLVVDNAGRNVLVANYTGGSITVFPILSDGRLGAATAHIQHPAPSPHAHCITLDAANRFALVCDLGLNRIYSYEFNSTQGTLATNTVPWTPVSSGAGPRHLAFDPQYRRAYAICELNSTIIGFNYDAQNGTLSPIQTSSTLPSGWSGQNAAAEIAVAASGRFVYGSNRGYNSIAVFSVDAVTGALTQIQQQSTAQTPRHFAFDPAGGFCLVAGQDANTVAVYAVDSQTGRLTPTTQTLRISKPVCILPVLTQPPQPVLALQPGADNTLHLDIGNGLPSLAYQLEQAPSLQPSNWNLLLTGSRGQTNFVLTNTESQSFFRASVSTNY